MTFELVDGSEFLLCFDCTQNLPENTEPLDDRIERRLKRFWKNTSCPRCGHQSTMTWEKHDRVGVVIANLSQYTPMERHFTRSTSPAVRCFSLSPSTQIHC